MYTQHTVHLIDFTGEFMLDQISSFDTYTVM